MEKGMISVDKWSGENSQAYFLTHLHADHTKGLSSSWNKSEAPLFCSPITAKLFPFKFPGFKLSLLRVLEIGITYSLTLFSPSTGSEVHVEVTAIDAVHCPGAVMYLFCGEFGCILYTGDFRWEGISEKALVGKSMLLNALGSDKIDILYLDNTYCNPSYSFPPREVVAQQVVDIIASHPEHDIIIAINTLGKEDLLLHIARALKIKIWVWPERLQTMHLLGYRDIFTTQTSLTRVRAVPFYSFSINTLEELNFTRPTIGIMPSGLPWMPRHSDENAYCHNSAHSIFSNGRSTSTTTSQCPQTSKDKRAPPSSTIKKIHRFIYSVPYSDHSCFDELHEFVKVFQPLRMFGIVSSSTCYIHPAHYLGHLCGADQFIGLPSKNFQKRKRMVNSVVTPLSLTQRRKRSMKVGHVRMSRVSALRRLSRGAKIVETVSAD